MSQTYIPAALESIGRERHRRHPVVVIAALAVFLSCSTQAQVNGTTASCDLPDEAQEKAQEEFLDNVAKAPERLRAELGSRTRLEPWEGEFSNLAPFGGMQAGWIIARHNGYVSTSRLRDVGRVELKGDRIFLVSASPAKPAPRPVEYVIVRWDQSVYLVAPELLLHFCNDVNGGAFHDGIPGWNYLLRARDVGKEPAGLPQVPKEFKKYLLKAPVRATVTKVGAGQVTARIPGAKEPIRGVSLIVNAGKNAGIWPGMRFFNPESVELYKTISVVRAQASTASLVVEGYTPGDRAVFIPGSQLSTLDPLYAEEEPPASLKESDSRIPRGRWRTREPSFRGKTLKTYIRDLKSQDDVCRAAAFDFLRYFTPRDQEAVPVLLEIAADGKDCFRSRAVFELGRLGKEGERTVPILLERLRDEEPFVRRNAAFALGRFRHHAKAAETDLLGMAAKDDSLVRPAAAFALGEIGAEPALAIPTLKEALKATDVDSLDRGALREQAARALDKLGQAGVAVLFRALQDKDESPRLVAATALWECSRAPEAINAFAASLRARDREVREQAALALQKIGPEAHAAIPALVAALKDKDDSVQFEAATALGEIGKPAVPALLRLLKDKDAGVRREAARALGLHVIDPQAVVPALSAALADEDWNVAPQAAKSLSTFGATATSAVPDLARAVKEARTGFDAIQALSVLGPVAAPAVPVLLEVLEDGGQHADIVTALGEIGPAAAPAIPALIARLRGEDVFLARTTAMSLAKIGANGTTVPLLIRALQAADIAAAAAEALGSLGPAAKSAVPSLAHLLNDRRWHVRAAAIEALGEIGPDSKAALHAVLNALTDPAHQVRANAAKALARIGNSDDKTIQALAAAMNDRKRNVRRWAALSYWHLQRRPETVVPVLTEYLAHTFPHWDRADFMEAVHCLAEIGPAAADAIPTLHHVLRYSPPWAKAGVADALRKLGGQP